MASDRFVPVLRLPRLFIDSAKIMANGALNVYKHYVPSVGAAVAFTVIFGALTIAHTALITRKKRFFTIIVVIGGICKLCPIEHNTQAD